ncbi:hypothetical protein ACNKHU_16445 [Shigella flexneri]
MTIWEISRKRLHRRRRRRHLQDQWHIFCNSLVSGITLSKARLHHAMAARDEGLSFASF